MSDRDCQHCHALRELVIKAQEAVCDGRYDEASAILERVEDVLHEEPEHGGQTDGMLIGIITSASWEAMGRVQRAACAVPEHHRLLVELAHHLQAAVVAAGLEFIAERAEVDEGSS